MKKNLSKNQKGSSETIRETFISLKKKRKLNNNDLDHGKNLFHFEQYLQFEITQQKPNHLFLEWFIGFFEADGSFCHWFDGKRNRFNIEINQKDPKLMYKIKKNLGFGSVIQFQRNNQIYWRYTTTRLSHIKKFILLFNGNLITEHKNEQFSKFLNKFNENYNESIMELNSKRLISLNNAWLSGFLEGDGGFFAMQRKLLNKKKLNSGLIIKFYVTQKQEILLLQQIKNLFEISTKLSQIHNGNQLQKYNRLETSNVTSLKLIKNYLQRYPFLGQKQIVIKRWIRLIDYKIKDYPMTPKSTKKLKQLIFSTKQSFCN